jgi:hypothetical protein
MGLSRLSNFLKSVRGNVLYVDGNSLDATDSIENQGNSLVRPFKTIQRALLEASRYSYQRGLDNDRFEKTSIVVYPGEHLIDNRPGWIPDGVDPTQRNFLLRSGVSSQNFFPFDDTTNFNLETDDNALYKLNSIYGGVIIPRGVSLVGIDLRKTKIRPRYVPNPENDNIERTAIFRLTGGCFLWNFTIFDANPAGQVYQDYTLNRRLPNYSHNKLTVFEYADGVNDVQIADQFLTYTTDRTDLDMYYEKVSIAYGLGSGRAINPTYPETGIDIQAITGEFQIVGSRGEEFIVDSIIAGDGTTSSDIITVTLNRPIVGLNVNTAIRIQGVPTPGYNGSFVITEVVNPTTIRYRAAIAPEIANPNLAGFNVNLIVVLDTVNSASPYIFNVSLRSVYGMCGLHADGDKADGFKSIVVAQYTGIGLQKDNNAFIKYNPDTNVYEDNTLVENLSSDSKAIFKPKYENFHIKASNDAFMQLVSVFAIGFAKQFVVESGGDFSITNSNSNFGAKALVASGFKRKAFPQDDVGYITHVIPPRQIESEPITLNFGSIDVNLTNNVGAAFTNRLYLYQETNIDIPPENVIDGYRIGAKKGETLSVIINQGGVSQTATSQVVMQVPEVPDPFVGLVNASSEKVYQVDVDENNLPSIENNKIQFITPHALKTGEKIRILSNVGFLPNGIESNQIYYAITFPNDPTSANKIEIAKSLNDAISGTAISINNGGQLLRVESRVSDKLSGEIGHPIQWEPSLQNWYITVNVNNNSIFDYIKSLGSGVLGDSTSRTFFTRTPDDRNLIDTIYRYRYVIPKDSLISSRTPIDGFVIQESNDTIGATSEEIQKYYNINNTSSLSENNPYELKNFRLIAFAIWNNGIGTFITEEPHDLGVFSEVEILNIRSTNNSQGLEDKGFNGKFFVVNVSDRKTFSVIMPIDPGTFTNFTNTIEQRDNTLPYFKRSRYRDTYSIYKSEEIQEYVPGQKDGIYHLFIVTNSITPFIDPFRELKLTQPIENFYPQKNRDNPRSEPEFTISYALPDPIGKVVVNNPESSITSESVGRFTSDANVGYGITDIQSNQIGTAHTIFTTIDHGLNRITKLTEPSPGSGYGTGLLQTEVFYNARLVGSATGEGATAVVRVTDGEIVGIRLMDGGSGYVKGQTLSIVGIPTSPGFVPSLVEVAEIYDDIDTNFRLEGVFASPFNVYNGVYRITSIPNSRQLQVVSTGPLFAEIPSIGPVPVIEINPSGLSQVDPLILQFSIFVTSGPAARVIGYTYNPTTGIATVNTGTKSHGYRIDNKVVMTGFVNPLTSTLSTDFNGEFFVKKVNSVTEFEIFVGRGITAPVVLLGQEYVNRPGFGAAGGPITQENEQTAGRLANRYGNLTTTLSLPVSETDTQIYLNNLDKLDLKLGDYLLIDYELMRVREDVSTNTIDPVKVFRGLLGTRRAFHVTGSYVERTDIFPIEFRRNSVIRASGHTFEYVGYGPGNYSTTLPERQDRVISKSEETLAQSFKIDGGVNVYTGMNDGGNFYIGNRRVVSTTGKEEIFDAPIPTITGEDPTGSGNFGFDLITPDEIRVSRSIKVEGGTNNNIISEFDGPLIVNNKITATQNVEAKSLFLKGNATVSRSYSVGISTPFAAGNPGDIVFDANPEGGGDLGWIYTTSNRWENFGLIKLDGAYNGNFTGIFSGDGSGLTGVSDVWTLDTNGIYYTGNVGIATNQSLPNFALHIFGGIKANGISEFNSQQITFNVPTLLNFNAVDTRVNQNFSVIGVSTFSNNILLKTITNDTDGRIIRFAQTDTTVLNNQGYGAIEWEGSDSGNSGVRGYIKGISEGTQGEFGLSFATQYQGSSNPQEQLRISGVGTAFFRKSVIAIDGFVGDLVGTATTATNARLTRITSDTSNQTRYLTFVSNTNEGFYNQRVSNNITFNPNTGDFKVTGITTTTNLVVSDKVLSNLVVQGTVTANSDQNLKTNVKTIKNALDKVLSLRGVEFDRKDSGEHQIGVIAQEVEKIIPEVVYGDETKSVAYGNLVGLLIEAIKEQQKEIEELKKTINKNK